MGPIGKRRKWSVLADMLPLFNTDTADLRDPVARPPVSLALRSVRAAGRLALVSGIGAVVPLLLTWLLLGVMAAAGAAAPPTPGILAAIWAGITFTMATAYLLARCSRATVK